MTSFTPLWIGIDVSSRVLDISLGSRGEVFQIENTPAGHRRLIKRCVGLPILGIICEATGSYHDQLAIALWDVALPLTIVNPAWIKAWRGHNGKYAKTDCADARLLADYGEYHCPTPSRVIPQIERDLKALLSTRSDLVAARVAENNRLKVSSHPAVKASQQRVIALLVSECRAIEKEIEALIATCPAWGIRRKILQSMPGIGPVISATLLALLPELGTLNRRQIAALAGVAPIPNESGTISGKRWVHRGRSDLRRMMYLASSRGRTNPALASRHERLKVRGKPPKVVLTAVARWMVTMLNVMVRDGLMWHELDQAQRIVEVTRT